MNKKEEKRTKLRWGAFYCLLFAVFALMIACHKTPVPEPEPEQDLETPDTTQVIDTTTYPDTVYLDWDWDWRVPPMDSVVFFAQQENVIKIVLNLRKNNTTSAHPNFFNDWRIVLQRRIDVAPSKVRGAGIIYVEPTFGAQLPDPTATNISGMAAVDSAWYVQNGWQIERGCPFYK